MLRIGMVAGEVSGDMLGAGLIHELSQSIPEYQLEGIGGSGLSKVGMNVLYPMERLSVMGLVEVLDRYTELKNIRNELRDYFINNPPDVFIGIDAPDFNLWLEKELRQKGITTVHYVSPSIWAWREYRVKKIAAAVDMILNLFPFEADFYNKHNITNRYVGHPLADKLNESPEADKAGRIELGIPLDKTVVALLPGSRSNEIKRIAAPLLQAALLAHQNNKELVFISGLVNEKLAEQFNLIKEMHTPNLDVTIHIGKTHQVMRAADAIVLASGTATLEAMLLGKPMVVAYRLSWITYLLVKMLAKIPHAALPNILAGKRLVAECLQHDCAPQKLFEELQKLLNAPDEMNEMKKQFADLSKQLRMNANARAAKTVMDLLEDNKLHV